MRIEQIQFYNCIKALLSKLSTISKEIIFSIIHIENKTSKSLDYWQSHYFFISVFRLPDIVMDELMVT